MSHYSQKLSLCLLSMGAVSAAGLATDSITSPASAASLDVADDMLVAQVVPMCDGGNYPNFYSQVQTSRDPLSVRQTPNGRVVGTIPSGWKVIVLEWSQDGAWAKVASHYAQYQSYEFGSGSYFGTAPDFNDGWVSAAYLKDLGRFCQKPTAAAMLLQPELFGASPMQVQEDWLAMGDSLVEGIA